MINRADFGAMPGRPDVRRHPGYLGMFTTAQAQGAIPNKTRVARRGAVAGETIPNDMLGTIVGSVISSGPPRRFFYYVVWDATPKTVNGLSSDGLRLLKDGDFSNATLLPNRDHMAP